MSKRDGSRQYTHKLMAANFVPAIDAPSDGTTDDVNELCAEVKRRVLAKRLAAMTPDERGELGRLVSDLCWAVTS